QPYEDQERTARRLGAGEKGAWQQAGRPSARLRLPPPCLGGRPPEGKGAERTARPERRCWSTPWPWPTGPVRSHWRMALASPCGAAAARAPAPPALAAGPPPRSKVQAEASALAGAAWHPSGAAGAAALLAAAAAARPRRAGRAAQCGRGAGAGRRRRRPGVASAASAPAADSAAGAPKVVLLGDSVFDNFYWLQTPKRHLRVQLQELLRKRGRQEEVVNLAVDQMTTFDFEERSMKKNPWDVYLTARTQVDFDDEQDRTYPVAKDGFIRSVASLKRLKNVQWALISIGGNDVLLNPFVQSTLTTSLLPGQGGNREKVANEFSARLRGLVQSVRMAQPDASIALVVPYRPHLEHSLVFGAPVNADGEKVSGDVVGDIARGLERQYLSTLVTPMAREILAVGREFGCPVVDLSKTFDPTEEQHYGTGKIGNVNELGVAWSGAEPSDVGSAFISELLARVVQDGPPVEPTIYSGRPERKSNGWSLMVKSQPNDPMELDTYQFGPVQGQAGAPSQSDATSLWFSIGVAIAVLVNGASLLDALVFSRDEFEAELSSNKVQVQNLQTVPRQDADAQGAPQ
ncbi:unnamed protein product, partial [Prorocentrum cordatum]